MADVVQYPFDAAKFDPVKDTADALTDVSGTSVAIYRLGDRLEIENMFPGT